MARVIYEPNHADESLDIDPVTNQATVTTHGPRHDDWMILLVLVGLAVLAVVVIIIMGLGFMDLAFGST